MKRKLFIESIEAIRLQQSYDKGIASHLSVVLPNTFEGDLLYNNYPLSNALLKILQIENNDTNLCEFGQSWIEYFINELEFGVKYKDGMITQEGNNIDFSDSGKVWDYLNRK
jgi:hypothetical protein